MSSDESFRIPPAPGRAARTNGQDGPAAREGAPPAWQGEVLRGNAPTGAPGRGGEWQADPLAGADERRADLAFGQIVVVAARWILIGAGLLLALWAPNGPTELKVQAAVLLLLAVANFYLHAQLLNRRPLIDSVAYGASAADIAIITLLVAVNGGFSSNLYIFYFPAVLAFSVAFSTALTTGFAGACILVYVGVAAFSGGVADSSSLQALLTRVLMIAAVAVCGNLYWRIEGNRRRTAAEAHAALLAQLQARTAAPASAIEGNGAVPPVAAVSA